MQQFTAQYSDGSVGTWNKNEAYQQQPVIVPGMVVIAKSALVDAIEQALTSPTSAIGPKAETDLF